MKVAIFDMDGTLIDSSKDITISVNHVREANHSLEPLSEQYVVEIINMTNRNLAKLFYETDEYLQKDRDLFEKHYYDQCIVNVKLYEHIEDVLDELTEDGIKCAVATNAPSIFAKRMLEHLNIVDYFEHIVGSDMVENSKPHRDMLDLILDNYDYNSCFMIGDNDKDMLAGENVGANTLFATWGFGEANSEYKNLKTPLAILSYVQS